MLPDTLEEYTLGKTIGKGAFSVVKLAQCTSNGDTVYAVKIIESKHLSTDVKAKLMVDNEINVLKMLDHPHIIKLYKVLTTPSQIYLVLDWYAGGDLFEFIATQHQQLTVDGTKSIVRQLLGATEYMHRQNIVHRDLKAENILLTTRLPPFSICITDFGFACPVLPSPSPTRYKSFSAKSSMTGMDGPVADDGQSSSMRIETNQDIIQPLTAHLLTTRCGSEEYTAPEVIMGKPYDGKLADIWSAGVIIYALLVGYLPFAVEPRDVLVEEQVQVEVTVPVLESQPLSTVTSSEVIGEQSSLTSFIPSQESSSLKSVNTSNDLIPLMTDVSDSVNDNSSPMFASSETPSTPVTDGFFSNLLSPSIHNTYSHLPPNASPQVPMHISLPRLGKTYGTDMSPSSALPGSLSYLDLDPSSPRLTRHLPKHVTVMRRRSVRKAGRKALWHRIARVEFTFPDEAVVIGPEQQNNGTTSTNLTDSDCADIPTEPLPQHRLLSVQAKDLIRSMMEGKPDKRKSADILLEHEWLQM